MTNRWGGGGAFKGASEVCPAYLAHIFSLRWPIIDIFPHWLETEAKGRILRVHSMGIRISSKFA